jgi:hypothetical protein
MEDHYLVSSIIPPPDQQQQRSLVIYQHRILIRRLGPRHHRGGPEQHPAAHHHHHHHHHHYQDEHDSFNSGNNNNYSNNNYSIPSRRSTTSSSSTTFFFTRDTTSLMRRTRRDLQTYPPPVVIKLMYQERVIQIPDEVWYKIGQFCEATDLHHLRRCHPRLRRLLLHNAAGWKNLCHQLWRRRHHVCPAARALVEEQQPNENRAEYSDIQAYELSVQDAGRDTLTDDELCDTVWWFRFKTTAGVDWIRDDPWHRGEQAVQMVFMRNGRVILSPTQTATNPHQGLHAAVVISWQWIEWPALLADDDEVIAMNRGRGAYLRLTVSGRDVPTYIVRRFPSNWGFVMENCWGVFASFELQQKKTTTNTTNTSLLLQLTGPVPSSTNTSQHHGHHQDGGSSAGGNPPRKRQRRTTAVVVTEDDLATECYFIINGQNQWREAFLYNIGARHIPHGPNAMEGFRHACEAALHAGQRS